MSVNPDDWWNLVIADGETAKSSLAQMEKCIDDCIESIKRHAPFAKLYKSDTFNRRLSWLRGLVAKEANKETKE